jgi:WD40 repeat protein
MRSGRWCRNISDRPGAPARAPPRNEVTASRTCWPGLALVLRKAVTALAYAPGGVILAVGYASGTTALWDTDTGKATAHLAVPGSGNAVESLAFAPDASLLAVASQARSTYLWHITQLP